MAVLADKNGDVSKPLLSTKGAADFEQDECAGHRESALAYLIRCAARIPLEHAPFSHDKLTYKRHRRMCCVCACITVQDGASPVLLASIDNSSTYHRPLASGCSGHKANVVT